MLPPVSLYRYTPGTSGSCATFSRSLSCLPDVIANYETKPIPVTAPSGRGSVRRLRNEPNLGDVREGCGNRSLALKRRGRGGSDDYETKPFLKPEQADCQSAAACQAAPQVYFKCGTGGAVCPPLSFLFS